MAELDGARLEGGLWCHEVLERLDAFVDGSLAAEEVARVEDHVRACDVCARFGGAYAGLVRSLRERLGAAEPMEEAVARRLAERLERDLDGDER